MQDNMPNPKNRSSISTADRQAKIFTPGMPVTIEGIPFVSKGLKKNTLLLKMVTPENHKILQNRFMRMENERNSNEGEVSSGEVQDNGSGEKQGSDQS